MKFFYDSVQPVFKYPLQLWVSLIIHFDYLSSNLPIRIPCSSGETLGFLRPTQLDSEVWNMAKQ